MDQAQALAVVRSLANGVDPESGEVFPPESAYQRPQVVRALYEASTALERIERFERRRAQMPAKTGEPWSEDEDRKLLAAFDAGRALQELAATHQRLTSVKRESLRQKRGDSPLVLPMDSEGDSFAPTRHADKMSRCAVATSAQRAPRSNGHSTSAKATVTPSVGALTSFPPSRCRSCAAPAIVT